ncbi:MAG: cobalamin-dependent protein [Deltaproteobacteria bacterium]|nr:cobalamin-dependent protein [Deltaproteobacteria bacterium]
MDMQSRLLIINCPSAYFVHVPMGTFGLCDYLSQKKIPVRMLNLALYDETKMATILNRYLEQFRPTHVGLTFHWQETAEGVLSVGQHVRSRMDQVKIICGGFTAGYFGEELLKKCPFVDYVVKGDPERPLELLLMGAEASEIPNLIYRDGGVVRANKASYCMDEETISRISFSRLTYLFDHELYIEALEEKLGFPLFIGRGCLFSCDYCGGSRESFRLHSARAKPVTRSIAAIIADLKRLKGFMKKIYICYEIDRDYIKALFETMKGERTLVKTFPPVRLDDS